MFKKRIIQIIVLLIIGVILLTFLSNYSIAKASQGKTFSNVNTIEKNRVGVVLGTAKYYKQGGINLYFKYRIDAAVELYVNDKIDFILVSGDNSTQSYNEPKNFKKELIKRGIPDNVIFLDYAGFRTLDSMVRAHAIFGLESFTVISQQFHNERAIYLADKNGLNVIGYNATDVSGSNGFKVKLREYFARTKAYLDVLFNVEPKFYGEKIEIKAIEQDTVTSNSSFKKATKNEL